MKIKKSNTFLISVVFTAFFCNNLFAQNYSQKDPITFGLQTIGDKPVDVVIDTDAFNEIDDQFALVYGLVSPKSMNVKAVYAAPFVKRGTPDPKEGMQKSYEEILRIFDRMKIGAVGKTFKGSSAFLVNKNTPVESDAAKDLVKKAMAAKKPLYVLALGAPTNVASALLMQPAIKEKLIVVWLGGKGLGWKTADEYNLKQDIIASQILFDSGVPLIQIPTEPVSSHLLTTISEINAHLKGKNPISNYLCDIYQAFRANHFGYAKVIWDISVIAYMINEKWFESEVRSTPILTNQLTYSFDHSRYLYRVVTFIDRNKVFTDMFSKIANYK